MPFAAWLAIRLSVWPGTSAWSRTCAIAGSSAVPRILASINVKRRATFSLLGRSRTWFAPRVGFMIPGAFS